MGEEGKSQVQGGTSDRLITREEVLGGLPARRAQTLLFLIESRTAHLVAKSRQGIDLFATEQAERERDRAFLEAFALGREPPLRPTIQDLEGHAEQWAPLVPENPSIRAAVAHLLTRKYVLARDHVPGIRAALGLDEGTVQHVYERLYGQPLENFYAPQVTSTGRLRWAWSALGKRLAALSPFWFAFVYTFALGVPQATVAVPIAVAAVGPLPGIAMTLAAALVSVVTVTCMAEASARSGIVRYGTAYTGRLAADYLGAAGSGLLSVALFLAFLLTIPAGFFAMARHLTQLTRLSPVLWTALLFAGAMYLLSRGSVTFSLALLVTLAAVILVLLIVIMALTLGHFRFDYVAREGAPLRSLSWANLENTVGVILMVFFGEAFVVQCAKVVLPRDPSGRSLIWGSVAGLAGIATLLAIWILVVNGSVAPDALVGYTGTVIGPLAAEIGPPIRAFGFLLVLLLPGLAALRGMIGAFNQVREWLPEKASAIVALPRGRGRLMLQRPREPAGGLRLGITYLGLERGQPRFLVEAQADGVTYRDEVPVVGRWEATALFDRLPALRKRGVHVALDVLESSEQTARVQVTSPLAITYEGDWHVEAAAGIADRRGATATASRARRVYLSDRARFFISVSPIAAVFLLAEWLLLIGRDSFTGVINVLGVLTNTIFSGVIPVFLLVATRRKGEVVPGVVLPFVGHPLVLGGVYVLYVAILLLHGLVIWQDPLGRAAALLTTALVLGATVAIVRAGGLTRRIVVELREDLRKGGKSAFGVTAVGQPARTDVRLDYPDGEHHLEIASGELPSFTALRRATFRLPATQARELKVWAHRVTPEGTSEGLPALLEVHRGGETKQFDLKLSSGQAVLPIGDEPCWLTITLPGPSGS